MKRFAIGSVVPKSRLPRLHVHVGVLAVALLIGLVCTGCVQADRTPLPRAVAGVLDLRDCDLGRSAPLPLNGEWEFYWARFLTPENFSSDKPLPRPTGLLALPGSWRGYSYKGNRLGGTGQATLRLRILTKPGQGELTLRLIDVHQAYNLWANGKLVAHGGTVGRSSEEEVPRRSLELPRVTPVNGEIDLVLQISNHHFRVGGVLEPILVAPAGRLEASRTQDHGLALFCVGSILVIGLYHLALYLMRRKDLASLYIGLYCMVVTGYTVTSNTSLWVLHVFAPGLDPQLMEKLSLLFFMAWPSLRFRFFRTLYPNEFHRIIERIGDVRVVVFLGFLLFAPGRPLYWYVLVCLVMSLFFGLYNIQRLAVCVRRKRHGAWLMLIGCGIHMATGLNDVCNHAGWINTMYLLNPGMFVFILSQAMALSVHFTEAFNTVEHLSAELEEKNVRLEREMAERDRLAREVVNISEEERRRISHELHDGLCQKLTGARLRASVLAKRLADSEAGEELTRLAELLEASGNDAYNTSRGLWPVEHDPSIPGPSLGDLAHSLSHSTGMDIRFERQLQCGHCVNPHATVLYRIAQEALANAVKHSSADRITMTLHCEAPDRLVLKVSDDGIGRETADAAGNGRTGGLGMGIMAHRARIIGADLRIEDRPGGGTLVTCSVPCETACHNGRAPKEESHGGR